MHKKVPPNRAPYGAETGKLDEVGARPTRAEPLVQMPKLVLVRQGMYKVFDFTPNFVSLDHPLEAQPSVQRVRVQRVQNLVCAPHRPPRVEVIAIQVFKLVRFARSHFLYGRHAVGSIAKRVPNSRTDHQYELVRSQEMVPPCVEVKIHVFFFCKKKAKRRRLILAIYEERARELCGL